MSMWKVLQAMCLLGLLSETLSQVYEGDFSVNFMDYYNEISEGGQPETEVVPEGTDPPCSVPELSKWDKLFTMLENSQMKENMLLQHSDDLVRVELQGLREDLLRLSAQYSSPCPSPDEDHARRAEQVLREAVSGLSGRLDAVLEVVREQNERADGQDVCCDGWKRAAEQLASSLQGAATEGRDLRKRAGLYVEAALGRLLPAGCEMALFFPMRSPKSHAEVTIQGSMQTDALTVCLWVKPTQVQDKAVLFSYGTSSNPLELQLLLSGRSVLFTVRGEAHLVEAPGAVEEGEWAHVCGTWGSEHGMATLWVDGREAARSPGVAEGHRLHGGGSLVLGQDSSWQGLGRGLMTRFSFQGEPDEQQAFAGKMTGVNVWNRVLGDEEISQQAEQEGRACGDRGNLVAWGVSQITRSGDVQLVF